MCGSELGQAAVWMESWQKVPLADYQNRDNFLNGFTGDAGRWLVDDHIDECDGVNPHPPIARIAADGANHILRLIIPDNTCTTDLTLESYSSPEIPITSKTRLAITESGALVDPGWNGFFPTLFPPPGDQVHLVLQDQKGNLLIYMFQRTASYPAHTESLDVQFQDGTFGKIGYREVFMDDAAAAGGSYVANVYADFSKVPGFNSVGAKITPIGLHISGVGTASFDDFQIGDDLAAVAPTIATQPQSQTVAEGGNASFLVVADGTKPFSYQWQKSGIDLPAATNSTLLLFAVSSSDAAESRVSVKNATGAVLSQGAVLTVQAVITPPSVSIQPSDQTVLAGQRVTFNAVASGSPPLQFQWRKNGSDIPALGTISMPAGTNMVICFKGVSTRPWIIPTRSGPFLSESTTEARLSAPTGPRMGIIMGFC